LHNGLLLTASQQPLDHNYYQEHFKWQESQVADHVNEDMVNIVKYGIVDEIYQRGERNEAASKNNKCEVTFRCFPPVAVIVCRFSIQDDTTSAGKSGKNVKEARFSHLLTCAVVLAV